MKLMLGKFSSWILASYAVSRFQTQYYFFQGGFFFKFVMPNPKWPKADSEKASMVGGKVVAPKISTAQPLGTVNGSSFGKAFVGVTKSKLLR